MAMIAAMKNVLSPISLHRMRPHDFMKPCAQAGQPRRAQRRLRG